MPNLFMSLELANIKKKDIDGQRNILNNAMGIQSAKFDCRKFHKKTAS